MLSTYASVTMESLSTCCFT